MVVLVLPTAIFRKSLYTKRWMLSVFSGSTRSKQKEHKSLVRYVHREPRFLTKLWDRKVSSMPQLDGRQDSRNSMVVMKLLYRERDLVPVMLQSDAVYGITWTWSSVNPVMLVQSWRKFL
jgi:hypothetical protein